MTRAWFVVHLGYTVRSEKRTGEGREEDKAGDAELLAVTHESPGSVPQPGVLRMWLRRSSAFLAYRKPRVSRLHHLLGVLALDYNLSTQKVGQLSSEV